ncbi:hypothetical protein L210DRAFT_942009 [Boletus edulis BED1]|uniref:Uncharacterized protein n=1 Tax=Boletus edulis BED1 TaxID=1328754 RepID=A0AAD4BBB1_BOLED|nr:hypothetical protein L210DRAFT_942009 [Boletus edulis BED1]
MISRVISFVGLLALAASLPLFEREEPTALWVPATILYPNKWTVWCMGDSHQVCWNTTSPPDQTNLIGSIYLISASPLDRVSGNPLAQGFPLDVGAVTITVPTVTAGKYAVDLYGIDSTGETEGWSQFFEIDAC